MKSENNRSVSGVRRVARRMLPKLRGMFICPEPIRTWKPDNPEKVEENLTLNSQYIEWLLNEG